MTIRSSRHRALIGLTLAIAGLLPACQPASSPPITTTAGEAPSADVVDFLEPNAIERYSVGTKNKDLTKAADGPLTLYVQATDPADPVERANWLPSPANADFSLYVRAYWPENAIKGGQWMPPAVVRR
jgi:hypothetical protein